MCFSALHRVSAAPYSWAENGQGATIAKIRSGIVRSPSKRNFARHGPERVAIKQLRVAWRVAAAHADPERALRAEVPATTASREDPGPFVRLV